MQKLLEEKLEETVHLQGSDGEFQEEEHCREHEFVDLDDGSGAACLQCGAVMAETGQGLVLADADEFDAERGGRIGTTFHHSDLGIRRRTARSGPGRSMTLNAKHLLRVN